LRLAGLLDERAARTGNADDAKASTLLRLLYGMIQADQINRKVLTRVQR
jgi:hypothetical protein